MTGVNSHSKVSSEDIGKENTRNILKRNDNLVNANEHASIGTDYTFTHEVVWINAIGYFVLHILALWGLYLLLTEHVKFCTFLWGFVVMYSSTEGVTIGAHRLYAHKSFKATPLLKGILIALQTIAGQNCIFTWCRDHRLHHRYSDTDADPHNAKRGFFFSHIGWLMTKKHPYIIKFGKHIDMSDLEADWMIMFQKKYYYQLYFLLAVVLPVSVPVHFFGETLWHSLLVCYFLRYVFELNESWLVNSAAHKWGTRPYDQNRQPVESHFISFISLGEGWHNYHHTFPWDYKAAEISMHFNFTASLIRFFETIGLAYDLKSASPKMIQTRIMRTGDGTHHILGNDEARSSVTAFGVLHPINPSYTTKFKIPETMLTPKGLPLYHEKDVIKFDNINT